MIIPVSTPPPIITLRLLGPKSVPNAGVGETNVTWLAEGNKLSINPKLALVLSKLIDVPSGPIKATPLTLPPDHIPSTPACANVILEKYKKYVL